MNTLSPILSITGSDSTGGAGIQADIKTMQRLGAEALTVVTSVTMQNTLGIQEFYDLPSEVVERQIDAVADDAMPQVVKIGMVRTRETLSAIVRQLQRHKPRWVLFSPVVSSSRGEQLMDEGLIGSICRQLLPLCSLVVVRGRDADSFPARHVVMEDGGHGRCNELCSAIAVYLNQGLEREEAIRKARRALSPVQTETGAALSLRVLSLYQEFSALQESVCKNCCDVNYYASRLNVSSRYLSQITRKVAGQAPKAIIDATLLERIRQLLGEDLTVQEIAYSLGFSSQAHLTSFFKKATGMTPTDYRRL